MPDNKLDEGKMVVLDGQPVTLGYIREQQKRTDIRIVETSPNTYKTLSRMQG